MKTWMKVLIGVGVALILFLGFVATRPDEAHYERSGVILAGPEKIFPYLDNFKVSGQWSPYEQMDPNMKKTLLGPESGPGAVMEFAGNSDVGTGRLEILKVVPNSSVQIRLEMLEPFKVTNTVTYTLTPEGNGTRFTWSMDGPHTFLSKLLCLLIDGDKMVGEQFEKGISNLKTLIESHP